MAEDNCVLPKCLMCNVGYLLPFSFKDDVFEKWKCSNPECKAEIRKREDR